MGRPSRGRLPGEPGIGVDLAPPFCAEDEATRWLFNLNRYGIRPGLVRIQGLLDDIGNPERGLRTLVIAGTNGKGTTTRILAHLLRQAGLRVAAYTSPHLLRVYERLTIDGEPVDPARLAAEATAIRPLVERHEASWFETMTALAVKICSAEKIDVLCAEAGLGGRLDATNALPALATLLTTVDLDHQHILGQTRREILAEKLGLLKPDTPFFCGVDPDLRDQARAAAEAARSPLFVLDELASWEDGRTAGTWRLDLRGRVIDDLPRLSCGALQRNAALALLCLDELARRGLLPELADPAAALSDLFLPGVFQVLGRSPTWICDTAHNTQALRGVLSHFLSLPTSGRKIVIFGGMRDKEVDASLGPLLRRCDAVTMAPIALPRSRNREDLELLQRFLELQNHDGHSLMDTVPQALSYWRERLQPEDAVLVTGSCFLVAEFLHHMGYKTLEQTGHRCSDGPVALA